MTLTKSIIEDYKEFASWYSEFLAKNDVRSFFILTEYSQKQWFDYVQQQHKDLRLKINDLQYWLNIEFENRAKKLDDKAFNEIKNKFSETFSNFCRWIPIHMQSKVKSVEDLKLPLINIENNTHRFEKTTNILKEMRSHTDNIEDRKIFDQTIRQLEKYWEEHSAANKTIKVEMDTRCKAFLMLGHNSFDRNSCFNEKRSRVNKYNLACGKNTLVLNFYSDKKHIGRAWGVLDKNIMHLTNLYCVNGTHIGNIKTACLYLFADLMNIKEERVIESEGVFDCDNVYVNDGFKTVSYSIDKKIERTKKFTFRFKYC